MPAFSWLVHGIDVGRAESWRVTPAKALAKVPFKLSLPRLRIRSRIRYCRRYFKASSGADHNGVWLCTLALKNNCIFVGREMYGERAGAQAGVPSNVLSCALPLAVLATEAPRSSLWTTLKSLPAPIAMVARSHAHCNGYLLVHIRKNLWRRQAHTTDAALFDRFFRSAFAAQIAVRLIDLPRATSKQYLEISWSVNRQIFTSCTLRSINASSVMNGRSQ